MQKHKSSIPLCWSLVWSKKSENVERTYIWILRKVQMPYHACRMSTHCPINTLLPALPSGAPQITHYHLPDVVLCGLQGKEPFHFGNNCTANIQTQLQTNKGWMNTSKVQRLMEAFDTQISDYGTNTAKIFQCHIKSSTRQHLDATRPWSINSTVPPPGSECRWLQGGFGSGSSPFTTSCFNITRFCDDRAPHLYMCQKSKGP